MISCDKVTFCGFVLSVWMTQGCRRSNSVEETEWKDRIFKLCCTRRFHDCERVGGKTSFREQKKKQDKAEFLLLFYISVVWCCKISTRDAVVFYLFIYFFGGGGWGLRTRWRYNRYWRWTSSSPCNPGKEHPRECYGFDTTDRSACLLIKRFSSSRCKHMGIKMADSL